MPDAWAFGLARDSERILADGTVLPSRAQVLLLNSVAVGEIEIHTHRRRGRDGKPDVSYGVTAVVYGPPPGGN